MEVALYDPQFGYYTRLGADIGPEADYITSPELHPAFGVLLTVQLAEFWRVLGEPNPFWLVEAGPGRGTLTFDVLRTAATSFPALAEAMRVALLERSPSMRARQAALLAPWLERITWLDADADNWSTLGEGCIVANELLDALPVHRVVMRESGLSEVFVAADQRGLFEEEAAPSSEQLAAQIAAGGGHLRPGQRGEVNLRASRWMRRASRLLDRGFMLLVDYGGPAADLYGPRHPRGTIRAYYRHVLSEDVLSRVGVQDLTAHVDFSAVTRAAESEELRLLGATRQATWLTRLGLDVLIARSRIAIAERGPQRAHETALRLLGHPRALGALLVAVFGKEVSTEPGAGFVGSTAPPEPPFLWESLRGDPRHVLAMSHEGAP